MHYRLVHKSYHHIQKRQTKAFCFVNRDDQGIIVWSPIVCLFWSQWTTWPGRSSNFNPCQNTAKFRDHLNHAVELFSKSHVINESLDLCSGFTHSKLQPYYMWWTLALQKWLFCVFWISCDWGIMLLGRCCALTQTCVSRHRQLVIVLVEVEIQLFSIIKWSHYRYFTWFGGRCFLKCCNTYINKQKRSITHTYIHILQIEANDDANWGS